ncbi:4Fe-4S dicluster domain-containing protein [candidate division KSB1 bacterium]|nr:4Fe-4S dicluster domain-containing protein [candidate division KSB1 bacterium]
MKITNKNIRFISLAAAISTVLPYSAGYLTGFYLWLSPFILLNSVLALRSVVLLNFAGLIVFLMICLKNFWFCRFLCPVGFLCDHVSKFRFKTNRLNHFPRIHQYLLVLALIVASFGAPIFIIFDPINIFVNFFDIFHLEYSNIIWLKISGLFIILTSNLIFPNLWCRRICPLGGLQHLIIDIKHFFKKNRQDQQIYFQPARRYFISGMTGAGLGLFLTKIAAFQKRNLIRPPGSLPEAQFTSVCARCGNCLKVCPTHIIKPSLNLNNLWDLMSPHLEFKQRYCLPDCNLCGIVCPSGAISTFSIARKKHLVIGIAQIELEKCLLKKNKECDRCKFYCSYNAITIKNDENSILAGPEIIIDRCVGCGACKIVCPTEAIEIYSI